MLSARPGRTSAARGYPRAALVRPGRALIDSSCKPAPPYGFHCPTRGTIKRKGPARESHKPPACARGGARGGFGGVSGPPEDPPRDHLSQTPRKMACVTVHVSMCWLRRTTLTCTRAQGVSAFEQGAQLVRTRNQLLDHEFLVFRPGAETLIIRGRKADSLCAQAAHIAHACVLTSSFLANTC